MRRGGGENERRGKRERGRERRVTYFLKVHVIILTSGGIVG